MPKEFLDCVARGGKVITVVSEDGKTYRKVCTIDGKSYTGEEHKRDEEKKQDREHK